MLRDACPGGVAVRRYANRWIPREARPRLQITDTRGRRPSSNDTERKHGGRDQGDCDPSDDGLKIAPGFGERKRNGGLRVGETWQCANQPVICADAIELS
jgi:hypothetical protein